MPNKPIKNKELQLSAVAALQGTTSVDAYLAGIAAFPILDAFEETRLAHAWRDNQDVQAAQRLVLSNLRFVVHTARKYFRYGLPKADIIQEGNIGLMKAVKRFDPDQGVRLISFAVHWIKAEIQEFVLRHFSVVKIATTKAQRKLFFNLRKHASTNRSLTLTEANDIAHTLDVDVEAVQHMDMRLKGQDVALEMPLPGTNQLTLADTLADDAHGPEAILAHEDFTRKQSNTLGKALATLDTRSQAIIQKRWLQEEKATLQELANEYHVSVERIRQLEEAGLKKLRLVIA